MREIKFRGKPLSKDLGWQFGDILHVDYLPESVLIGGVKYDEYGKKFQSGILVHPDTIGQFTGLLDKNGEEIYEGDNYKHGDSVLTVVWAEYGFCGFDSAKKEYYCLNKNHQKYYEVIGNIHDKEVSK